MRLEGTVERAGIGNRMGLGASSSSSQRTKVGLVFLGLGLLMLLWAWGNWIYRSSNGPAEISPVAADLADVERSPAAMQAVKASPFVLMVALFLVVVFLVGSYAIVRGGRRFREALFHQKPKPTTAEDLWSMHKAPTEE